MVYSKEQRIVNQMHGSTKKQRGQSIKNPIDIARNLPNRSGDHSRGNVRDTPTQDLDIPNKKYVDDNDLWETSGDFIQPKSGKAIQIIADSNDKVLRLQEESGGEYWDIEVDSSGDLKFVNDAGSDAIEIFDSTGNVYIKKDLQVAENIEHYGDTTTKIVFTTDDIEFYAGDEKLLRLFEGGSDYVQLGDYGDVDIYLNGDCFIDGATGNFSFYNKSLYAQEVHFIPDDLVPLNPAAYNLELGTNHVTLNCADADGCNITVTENNPTDGQIVVITNIGANVCNFTDTAGVTELAGNFAMGQWDTLTLIYVNDRWVEVCRSNN